MSSHQDQQEEWHVLYVPDPQLCSGASFLAVIKVIIAAEVVDHVVVVRMDAVNAGDAGLWVQPGQLLRLTIDEFLDRAGEVTQFVWADLLFVTEAMRLKDSDLERGLIELIRCASFAIRVVDNSGYEIYSRSPFVVQAIRDRFDNVDAWRGPLASYKMSH